MHLNRFTRFLPVVMLVILAACSAQSPAAQTPTAPAAPPSTAIPVTGATPQTTAPTGLPPVTGPAACVAPAALTPASTAGPYYKAGAPERANLAENLPGTRLLLTGQVLDTNCQPIPGAKVDFWQADSQGNYDNSGYTLRGWQTTTADGSYRLETVIPGQYPGRTEHIHVTVTPPGGQPLTTQLYLPDSTTNQSDRIFNDALKITIISSSASDMQASFNFIVAANP